MMLAVAVATAISIGTGTITYYVGGALTFFVVLRATKSRTPPHRFGAFAGWAVFMGLFLWGNS